MMPVYFDVMQIITDGGYGAAGVDLFGGEWGDVDSQVLCLEGPGVPSTVSEQYENPSVQILVRGEKRGRDLDVYTRAKELSNYLLALPACIEVNGRGYTGFEEGSTIAPLGKDANERFVYSMNFYTWRNRG